MSATVIVSARQRQQTAVYCFCTDAGEFWTKIGFTAVPVTELLQMLPNAPQIA